MGDRLSHAHKSGPMPKVKEALPLVPAGAGAAILLCIQSFLAAAPTPSPPGIPEKRITHPLWSLFMYVVAAKIFLMFSNVSCFWFFMLVPQTFHLITRINTTLLSYINLYDLAKKKELGPKLYSLACPNKLFWEIAFLSCQNFLQHHPHRRTIMKTATLTQQFWNSLSHFKWSSNF